MQYSHNGYGPGTFTFSLGDPRTPIGQKSRATGDGTLAFGKPHGSSGPNVMNDGRSNPVAYGTVGVPSHGGGGSSYQPPRDYAFANGSGVYGPSGDGAAMGPRDLPWFGYHNG